MSDIIVGTFFGTAFILATIVINLQSKSKKSIGTQTFYKGYNVETQTYQDPEFSEGVFLYDSGMSTTSESCAADSGDGSRSDYWNLRMVVDGLISENLFFE